MRAPALISTLFLSVALLAFASPAHADQTQWQKKHPGRTKLAKERRQDRRKINREAASGKISAGQAQADRNEVNAMGNDVRSEAHANENGGHLSGQQYQNAQQQQQQFKQQLNNQGQ